MRKQIFCLFLVLILFLSVLGVVPSVQAQTLTPTPTQTPMAVQPISALTLNSERLSFEQLGISEINLVGPYDRTYFTFSVPSSWKLNAGAELNLILNVSIIRGLAISTTSATPAATNLISEVISGGTLTVQLNGNTIADIPITQEGQIPVSLKLPLEYFTSNRPDGAMLVGLILNGDTSCEIHYSQLDVTVRTT
jgi:hypothetical protein